MSGQSLPDFGQVAVLGVEDVPLQEMPGERQAVGHLLRPTTAAPGEKSRQHQETLVIGLALTA